MDRTLTTGTFKFRIDKVGGDIHIMSMHITEQTLTASIVVPLIQHFAVLQQFLQTDIHTHRQTDTTERRYALRINQHTYRGAGHY